MLRTLILSLILTPALASAAEPDSSLSDVALAERLRADRGFLSAARRHPIPRDLARPGRPGLVVPSGATEQGRWYGYGSTVGRSLGFNLAPETWSVRGEHLMGDIAGTSSGLAQAGVGWRKGGLQASVGYTRYGDAYRDRTDERNKADDRVGLRLSLRRP